MIRDGVRAGHHTGAGPLGFQDESAEVLAMVRGFEVDECRVPETAPCEWVCRGCGEVNAIELNGPREQVCEGCGALRPERYVRRVRG